jgi:hypothetical protein
MPTEIYRCGVQINKKINVVIVFIYHIYFLSLLCNQSDKNEDMKRADITTMRTVTFKDGSLEVPAEIFTNDFWNRETTVAEAARLSKSWIAMHTPGDHTGAVESVGICTLLEELYPGTDPVTGMPNWFGPSYEESSDKVVEWCIANNAIVYAHPKEGFSELVALDLAAIHGKKCVVLENLS